MASLLENPNFSWFTWNPTAWTNPAVGTQTESQITTPLNVGSPILGQGGGGGGGGGNGRGITPILPTYGVQQDDENWLAKQIAFYRNKLPSWASPVGIMNTLMGRPGATESFAGEGGVGSTAGLYQGEVDLLNELAQQGFLVNTPGGIQTTSGKNVVSALGGYEEGQEEAYNLIKSRYQNLGFNTDDEIIDELTRKFGVGQNTITNRFKEAQFITQRNQNIREERNRAIQANLEKEEDERSWLEKTETDKTTDTTDKFVHELSEIQPDKFVHEMSEEPSVSEPVSVSVPHHISHGDPSDRGSDSGSEPAGTGSGAQGPAGGASTGGNYSGGWADDGYWAKGGLIRKNYSPGGIVGIL